jgi:aryl-alcohol dehydrogenase (NADP+)
MMSFGSSKWQPWVIEGDEGVRFVRLALDRGINFFDTADFYSFGASEEVLGRAIQQSVPRDEVVIATKVGLPMRDGPNGGGLSRKHIMHAVDASLRRLQTDYIDLYQIHKWDPTTPMEETVGALNDVVRAGKVRYLGVSNTASWQLALAQCHARQRGGAPFQSVQAQYNLAYREDEREMLPFCAAEGLGVIGYSPLARGWLAGARRTGQQGLTGREAKRAKSDAKALHLYGSAGDEAVLDRLVNVAQERGITPSQVAIGWIVSHDLVASVIVGAMEEHHLDAALGALELPLLPEELRRLEEVYAPQPVKDDAMRVALGSEAPQR